VLPRHKAVMCKTERELGIPLNFKIFQEMPYEPGKGPWQRSSLINLKGKEFYFFE
jgi:hypothetical protein